jgi:hypothetical protein
MDYMFDITPIFEAIIALAAAIVTSLLIPYIRSRTTAEQQENINAWVQIAVTAAEQIFKGSGRGAEKYEYVIEFLADKGFNLDEKTVDVLIEAAVKALNEGLM